MRTISSNKACVTQFSTSPWSTHFLERIERKCLNACFLPNVSDDVFARTDNAVHYLQSLKGCWREQAAFLLAICSHMQDPSESQREGILLHFRVHNLSLYPPAVEVQLYPVCLHTSVIHKMSQVITVNPLDNVYTEMCLAEAGLAPVSHLGQRTLRRHITSPKRNKNHPSCLKNISFQCSWFTVCIS